jgi:hypothetical protein
VRLRVIQAKGVRRDGAPAGMGGGLASGYSQ